MPDTPVNPVNKYTLKEWIRHPTTIMLIVAVNLIWILIIVIVNMGKDSGDDRNRDCQRQLVRSQAREEALQEQLDKYTMTILFKDGQILVRDNVIDSLKKKEAR